LAGRQVPRIQGVISGLPRAGRRPPLATGPGVACRLVLARAPAAVGRRRHGPAPRQGQGHAPDPYGSL